MTGLSHWLRFQLCRSPAALERHNWTAGFEREREISGDSSLAAMLLYHFFTSNDFNRSKVPWNQTKKSQKNVSVSERWKNWCFYDHVSLTCYTSWTILRGYRRPNVKTSFTCAQYNMCKNKMPLYITTKRFITFAALRHYFHNTVMCNKCHQTCEHFIDIEKVQNNARHYGFYIIWLVLWRRQREYLWILNF